MQRRTDPVSTLDHEHSIAESDERRPYAPPRLDALGSWTALTLEQSVGIAFIRALLGDDLLWWPE